jgi:hypothetical protein
MNTTEVTVKIQAAGLAVKSGGWELIRNIDKSWYSHCKIMESSILLLFILTVAGEDCTDKLGIILIVRNLYNPHFISL